MIKGRIQMERELKRPKTDRALPYMQTLRWRACRKKRHSRREAERILAAYNRRVVFGTLNHYLCWRHNAWHIGHSDKRLSSALTLARNYNLD